MNVLKNFFNNEDGITAIEYAIIGVAMSSALYYIFNEGGFIQALETAWSTMTNKINQAGGIVENN